MGKPRIDETGKKYGRLTVLSYISKPGQKGKWQCKCECGNTILVDGADLRRGHTKSCGCYCKEQVSKASLKDYSGQTFGELYVIERDMHYQGKQVKTHWYCKCNACGNITSISSDSLKYGQISCGCLKSKGEYKISLLLNNNNILYKKEFSFKDYPNRRFDFALLDNNNNIYKLIEFDGIQHYYRPKEWLWSQNMSLEESKERDKEKNNIAKNKKIDLIRIPYWKLETLTIEQLLNNDFLVKEGDE